MARVRNDANDYVAIRPDGAPSDGSCSFERPASHSPATFSLLYESSDGRLCVFEDAAGHLSAVDASHML